MHSLFLYIDPGSGSYLLQMMIAGVLAGLFYIKAFWQQVKAFFTKPKKSEPADNDD
jgi:hypothetical protein